MNTEKRFFKLKASDTPDKIKQCLDDYKKYLSSVKEQFPEKAFNFANAQWHYDTEDSRCPHDAWLEALEIYEEKIPESTSKRTTNIKISLLGAYHDGIITIIYERVSLYYLNKTPGENNRFGLMKGLNFHGDWLIDEIYLTNEGLIIHDIEFANDARWTIHCEDIDYNWNPFEVEN